MYPTRMERLKAERKRRRRRRRLLMAVTAVLIAPALAVGSQFLWSDGSASSDTHPPQAQPPAQPPVQPAPDPSVQLTFVGDVMMSGKVETLLKQKGFDYPFASARTIFQQDDVTVANLETPITAGGSPAANKTYVYKSPPEAVPAMKAAGVDLVSLANNHSLDQGEKGLLDTFRTLEQNGIQYVGAGPDDDRAYAPVLVERNGVRVAFLGFSRVVPDVSWYAGKNKPGVAASYDPSRAVQSIREAREAADLVVVLVHWGQERADYPVDHQKTLAKTFIDAGADLVVGSHPHVLQGFESYRGKWIAYSLGNFIFTRSLDPKTWETMVLSATCKKDGECRLRMLPYRTELGQALPMNETDGAKLLKRVESLSEGVRIEPDGSVRLASEPAR